MPEENGGATALFSLDGISIHIPYLVYYLEALGLGILRSFAGDPQLAKHLPDIESLLTYRLDPSDLCRQRIPSGRLSSIIGWSGAEILSQLVDREWLMTERNEFEPLRRLLDGNRTLESSSRVLICGAGVCRLGDYFASLGNVKEVRCTDLSYLGLHFGRRLARGEGHLLPNSFRSLRVVLTVDPHEKRLQSHEQECRFHPPSGSGRKKLTYQVADAFNLERPQGMDLVFVPYLLDVFASPRMVTALVRICEKLYEGQKIFVLVTANSTRDPRLVGRTLAKCGFEILNLSLCELPYSLSSFGSGFVRSLYSTLVVEAIKMRETDPHAFGLALSIEDDLGIEQDDFHARYSLPWQKQKPFALSSVQWASVQRSLMLSNYGDFLESLLQGLGAQDRDKVVTYLLSQGCILLTIDS